jgi:hypothetical protein
MNLKTRLEKLEMDVLLSSGKVLKTYDEKDIIGIIQ